MGVRWDGKLKVGRRLRYGWSAAGRDCERSEAVCEVCIVNMGLMGDKATQGMGTSFLGTYDRELDTDDEDDQDLVFEEQFVLKVPEGEDCERLRKMAAAREVSNDVWFKFKGALFLLYNQKYKL